MGRAYWYVLVPFHWLLFPRLASGITAAADRAEAADSADRHEAAAELRS